MNIVLNLFSACKSKQTVSKFDFFKFIKIESESDIVTHLPVGVSKIKAVALSVLRQCIHMVDYSLRWPWSDTYHFVNSPFSTQESTRGLVVLIHGLRSHPSKWKHHLSILKRKPEFDCFVPHVPKKGLCSLAEATDLIFERILEYTQKNPGNPVGLIGHSNGCRIALELEVRLRERASSSPVYVSAIAGPIRGTTMMNLIEKIGIAKFFYSFDLRNEMLYGSPFALSLINRVKAPVKPGVHRAYQFFGTSQDLSVRGVNSSLPDLGLGEDKWLCIGHSHDSIVDAAMQVQMDWLMKKMQDK